MAVWTLYNSLSETPYGIVIVFTCLAVLLIGLLCALRKRNKGNNITSHKTSVEQTTVTKTDDLYHELQKQTDLSNKKYEDDNGDSDKITETKIQQITSQEHSEETTTVRKRVRTNQDTKGSHEVGQLQSDTNKTNSIEDIKSTDSNGIQHTSENKGTSVITKTVTETPCQFNTNNNNAQSIKTDIKNNDQSEENNEAKESKTKNLTVPVNQTPVLKSSDKSKSDENHIKAMPPQGENDAGYPAEKPNQNEKKKSSRETSKSADAMIPNTEQTTHEIKSDEKSEVIKIKTDVGSNQVFNNTFDSGEDCVSKLAETERSTQNNGHGCDKTVDEIYTNILETDILNKNLLDNKQISESKNISQDTADQLHSSIRSTETEKPDLNVSKDSNIEKIDKTCEIRMEINTTILEDICLDTADDIASADTLQHATDASDAVIATERLHMQPGDATTDNSCQHITDDYNAVITHAQNMENDEIFFNENHKPLPDNLYSRVDHLPISIDTDDKEKKCSEKTTDINDTKHIASEETQKKPNKDSKRINDKNQIVKTGGGVNNSQTVLSKDDKDTISHDSQSQKVDFNPQMNSEETPKNICKTDNVIVDRPESNTIVIQHAMTERNSQFIANADMAKIETSQQHNSKTEFFEPKQTYENKEKKGDSVSDIYDVNKLQTCEYIINQTEQCIDPEDVHIKNSYTLTTKKKKVPTATLR